MTIHKRPKSVSSAEPKQGSNKEIEYKHVREVVKQEFEQFYASPENQEKLANVIKWFDGFSLRTLEPLLTRLICEKNISYMLPTGHGGMVFVNSLSLYDKMIRHYSKLLFDLFGRHTPLKWKLANGKTWATTYCQFNYFKFVAEYDMIKHINLEEAIDPSEQQPQNGHKPKVGKNYYMRRREEMEEEGLVFLHSVEVSSPELYPEDAELMHPFHQGGGWDAACEEELEYSNTVQPLEIVFKNLSQYAMTAQEALEEENHVSIPNG